MTALRTRLARWRDRLRWRQRDRELRAEIAGHLAEATEEYLRRGLTRDEAARAARRDFGGLVATEEAHRDLRSIGLDQLVRDLRDAGRGLRRSPGFAATVVGVLAICTAAATAGLALLNTIVLRPLPYPSGDRLVAITHDLPGLQLDGVGISSAVFDHYRSGAVRSFEAIGTYEERTLALRTGDSAERVIAAFTSVDFFRVLGVAPIAGRLFTAADAAPGFSNMRWEIPVLLSHRLWVTRFGADPQVIGRVITLSDNRRVVVGVLPPHVAFPRPDTDIWMLLEPERSAGRFPGEFDWSAIGRLRAGVGVDAARAELAAILPAMAGRYRDATAERLAEAGIQPIVTPLKTRIIGSAASALWPLFGGMAVLLLIGGLNVAGLFLVRAEHRRREVAVRRALGAGAAAVTRMFVVEALLLTTAAAGCGLALAAAGLRLVTVLSIDVPRAEETSIDMVAVAFALAAAVVGAVLFALPAARRDRRRPAAGLLAGGAWSTGSRRDRRLRHVLIAAQVTLALVLLSSSALMVRTYRNLTRVDLGFSPDRLLVMDASLSTRRYRDNARIYTGLVARLRQLPGVVDASAVSTVPLAANEYRFPIDPAGAPLAFKFFVPGYFEAMRIPIVAGDGLADPGVATPADPVVVSGALARRLDPGGRGLGRQIRRLQEDGTTVDLAGVPVPPFTVAGVSGPVREASLRSEPTEVVYIPVREPAVERSIVPTNMTLVVRTQGPPRELAPAVRRAMHATSPDLSAGRVRTMDEIIGAARGTETALGALLAGAAAVSLLLGLVGIYGSVAHAARTRAREIGIRIALGARTGGAIGAVAAGTLVAALTGVGLGVAASLAATRTLDALLFGVDAADPITLLGATVALVVTVGGAAIVAAWRAGCVDPLRALRVD
jgi:predicted permease